MDKSEYLSLPTVTCLPPGEHPDELWGGTGEPWEMRGEDCLCCYPSVYKCRSLLEKHIKETLYTRLFLLIFLHFSLFLLFPALFFPLPFPPLLLLQIPVIFKVSDEAGIIYCSILVSKSITWLLPSPTFTTISSLKTKKMFVKDVLAKEKKSTSSCVLNQDGHY